MKRFIALAPGLLAIFPSLFLFINNKEVVGIPLYIFLPALFGIAAIISIFIILLQFFVKNYTKAIILACLTVVAIFYYGYFFLVMQTVHLGNIELNRHRIAIPLWCLGFLLIGFFLLRTKKNLNFIPKAIGIFTIILFAISLISFTTGMIWNNKPNQEIIPLYHKNTASLDYTNSILGYAPDVYYIIPDGYANSKVLEEFFGYDNNEFLSYLKNKGFTVIADSKSNYSKTLFSVPTTLNMEYIDTLTSNSLLSSPSTRRELFEQSEVVRLFKNLGYQYVAISSDSTTFSGRTSDVRFGPSLLFRLLIRPTIFDPFSQRFRNRVLNAFDAFNKVSAVTGPKFVLAHIISPHDPYVFGPNGENIGINTGETRSYNDMKLYLGQLEFVNKELEKTIDTILRNSTHAPIIIIQSDHGVFLPDSYREQVIQDQRFKNISAYMLPSGIATPPNTNVNTFRFIFNQYFGTSFDLLEDKNIYIGSSSSFSN